MMLNEGEIIEDCDAKQKVWVRNGQTYKAIPVKAGMTNGMLTEIKSGVKPGDKVVTDLRAAVKEEEEAQTQNPFMPGRRNNDKNKNSKK